MLLFHVVLSLFLPVHVVGRRLIISYKTADCAYVTPVYVALYKVLLFIIFVTEKCKIGKKNAMFKSKANLEVLKMCFGMCSCLCG